MIEIHENKYSKLIFDIINAIEKPIKDQGIEIEEEDGDKFFDALDDFLRKYYDVEITNYN